MTTKKSFRRIILWGMFLFVFVGATPLMAAVVGTSFTYQGQLRSSGNVANGNFDFRFRLYADLTTTTQIGSTVILNAQPVSSGLFTVNLDFGGGVFNGNARFLQIDVKTAGGSAYTGLVPRQELKPTPNALSVPWQGLYGDASLYKNNGTYGLRMENSGNGDGVRSITHTTSLNYASFYGYNLGTGTALYGQSSNGRGVYGQSDGTGDGVEGYATVAGKSGVYGHSVNGNGVWGSSTNSDGTTGISSGVGKSGIVGINNNNTSSNTIGVSALASKGIGLIATGNDTTYDDRLADIVLGGWYGEIFAQGFMDLESDGNVYVDLDRNNNDSNATFQISNGSYGLLLSAEENGLVTIPGNLQVKGNLTISGSKSGYVVDIAQNDDSVTLVVGDVVAISGVGKSILGQIPVIKVRRATAADAGAVAGIVDNRFNLQIPSMKPEPGESKLKSIERARAKASGPIEASAIYTTGTIACGGYCSIVTLGSFKAIKVDASLGAIRPGDRLTPSPRAGYAMKVTVPVPGTIVGKALGGLQTGTGTIPVLVTLQ